MDEDEGSITVELIECGTFETTSNDVGASDWKGPGSQGSKWSERSDSGPGAYVQTGRSIKLVCHDDGPNNLQGCTVSAGHESAPNTYCRDTYRLGTSDNNADAEGQLFRLQIHWVSTAPNAPNSPLEQSRALERQLAVGHEVWLVGCCKAVMTLMRVTKGTLNKRANLFSRHALAMARQTKVRSRERTCWVKLLERGRAAKTSGTPPLPKCAADPRLIPPVHDYSQVFGCLAACTLHM